VQVTVRGIVEDDRPDWCRLRQALWPGSPSDHDVETREYFAKPHGQLTILVAEVNDRVAGFLELDYRKYAPGCRSSPVPFIEGWYVEPDQRRRGVGRALLRAAETLARAAGHDEIASDVEIDNANGIDAHLASGYTEVERTISFRRSLREVSFLAPEPFER
jgi:aminoglycoside 6'-N-acetyltransferase I